MKPPVRRDAAANGGRTVAVKAPIAEWIQVAAYDSAGACEAGKTEWQERLAKSQVGSPDDRRNVIPFAVAALARCLPASQVPVK
jgi:hypothetical protein